MEEEVGWWLLGLLRDIVDVGVTPQAAKVVGVAPEPITSDRAEPSPPL